VVAVNSLPVITYDIECPDIDSRIIARQAMASGIRETWTTFPGFLASSQSEFRPVLDNRSGLPYAVSSLLKGKGSV